MSENIAYYKDAVFFKGVFYVETESVKQVSLHNRIDIPYSPSDIRLLKTDLKIEDYNKGIVFIDGFHSNMAHLLWDCMYPSWYGLFYVNERNSSEDFQWMVQHHNYLKFGSGWNSSVIEKFSGSKIITPELLSGMYQCPLRVPYLITGCKGIGIGCIDYNTFCVVKENRQGISDPIESFVDRFYARYKIKRKKIIVKNHAKKTPIEVIYVVNKRPYNKIETYIDDFQQAFSYICNFRIIDWSLYDFEQQLQILNSTNIIICGVGTARGNTPFMPNGSIEIQTNTHSLTLPGNINFFDYHIGTLSTNLKVINISNYSFFEAKNQLCSGQLKKTLEYALSIFPVHNPIDVSNNIPFEVSRLKKIVTKSDFEAWRISMSNDVGDLFVKIFPYENQDINASLADKKCLTEKIVRFALKKFK